VGARPLNQEEQHRLYLRGGRLWTVTDDPYDPRYGPPRQPTQAPATGGR
jgi:hypothetical protein